MFLRRHQPSRRGFALLSVLMALAIISVLAQNYLSVEGPEGKTFAEYQQDRATVAVTAANLRTAQTQFFMDTDGRRLPPEQLRAVLDNLSQRMGGEGRYFMDQNMVLNITTMVETRQFREQLPGNLPRFR